MNAQPFDISLVIARVQSQVSALRKVAGAADYASVRGLNDFPAPCAYVLLAREKGVPRETGHVTPGAQVRTMQKVAVTFGIVVAVRNYRESERGYQGNDSLQTILGQIRGALIGWAPQVDGADACSFLQGNLTQYDAGTLLWTDVFHTKHTIGAGA
jgi:hypothetical protein